MSRPEGYHHTEETKAKIRVAMIGRKFSAATLINMRAAFKRRDYRGEKNPAWKGGIHMARGRVMQYIDPGMYVPRSRLLAEQALGRPLDGSEVVHHKNDVKDDDRHDNLEVMLHDEHARFHALARLRDRKTGRWL